MYLCGLARRVAQCAHRLGNVSDFTRDVLSRGRSAHDHHGLPRKAAVLPEVVRVQLPAWELLAPRDGGDPGLAVVPVADHECVKGLDAPLLSILDHIACVITDRSVLCASFLS